MKKDLTQLISLNKNRYTRIQEQLSTQQSKKQQIVNEISDHRSKINNIRTQIKTNKLNYCVDITQKLVDVTFVKIHEFKQKKLAQDISDTELKIEDCNQSLKVVEQEIIKLQSELRTLLVKEEKYYYLVNA